MNSFMSPKPAMAVGVLVVVSLIISALGLIDAPVADFGMVFIMLFVGLLLASVLLYAAARLVKVPNASFAKMMTLSAFVSLVTNVVALVLGMAGLSVILLFIINIIIVIGLMHWYLKISILKTIGVLVVEFIIGLVIGAILFFTVGMSVLQMFMGVTPNADTIQTESTMIPSADSLNGVVQ